MTRSSPPDGRLDYTEWASRLTHSDHEKTQDEVMWRGQRSEPRPTPDEAKEPPHGEP